MGRKTNTKQKKRSGDEECRKPKTLVHNLGVISHIAIESKTNPDFREQIKSTFVGNLYSEPEQQSPHVLAKKTDPSQKPKVQKVQKLFEATRTDLVNCLAMADVLGVHSDAKLVVDCINQLSHHIQGMRDLYVKEGEISLLLTSIELERVRERLSVISRKQESMIGFTPRHRLSEQVYSREGHFPLPPRTDSTISHSDQFPDNWVWRR